MAEQNRNWGKKLLSIFIEPETEQTQTIAVPTPAAAGASQVAIQQTVAVQNAAGTGMVDKKFVDHFVEVLEKSNLKGPDYFEYMQSLKSLSGLGLEEGKQHQAAWASFKAMSGINNVSVLSTSAGQYVQMLAADRDAFLKDVDKAVEEKVGVLKTELQRLQNENEAAAKQIAELQQKITQHNEQIGKITGDIAEQSAKLTNNRNNYEITYASFVEQIKSDVEKIKQYLS
jgi:hypothetical protein